MQGKGRGASQREFTRFSRITAFFRPVPQAAREPRPPRPPGFWVTKHETRITNHGFLGFHETRITAFTLFTWLVWCTRGTEALQSCFFCPGLLGNRTGRRSPCGSRIGASQAFTRSQATDSKDFTKQESRGTSHGRYVLHESRVTKHDSRLCVFHETRDTKHGLYGARWY